MSAHTLKFSTRGPVLGLWRHSLLSVLLAWTAASVLAISALLYFGIDGVVSQQFERLRAERLSDAGKRAREAVKRELDALGNLGELLGNDTELINATYYHLYLDGEIAHPVAAVRRIALGFHLDAVRLWDTSGRLIAAAPALTPPVSPPPESRRANSRVTWVDGQPWLIANQPIVRSDNTLALLCLGRPLAAALAYAFPPGGEVHVRIIRPEETANGQRISLDGVGGPPVWLDVTVEDSAGRALAKVKTLLLWLMPGAGLTLLLLLGMTLHRQLKPLAQLTEAVAGVGRGEFAPVPAPPGNNEIARLITAYNTMTADLAKLRALERRIGQQERLSAIGRMAARIAHDMNNPLTVIQGVAELQKKQAEHDGDAQTAEDAALVLHHIKRCQRTVEQLLAYGRPVRLAPERHDLGASCRAMLARWSAQNPAQATYFEADHDLVVDIDPYQFERVMDNLLDNARDACPNGAIDITLRRAGDRVELRIRDQGPGFPAAIRAHLFEPFHTTKRGGSGLGLASCLAIVEAHGGEMALGDGPGGEVVVRLPLQPGSFMPDSTAMA